MKEYYDARAPEYDEWYLGLGKFSARERAGWEEAVAELERELAALPPARTLDVACGTAFLTRHLTGEITGLDHSERMLDIARRRVPAGTFVQGDATRLPFADRAFDRVFTAHFYGHLNEPDRAAFLTEARRVGAELVVVDSAVRPDHAGEEWQERVLNDGSRHRVYKRYFDAEELARELGCGRILHAGDWFVMVAAGRPTPADSDRTPAPPRPTVTTRPPRQRPASAG
jgi:ubiquinone/menaquinone biosynthesis C-methylase UbiE